jgi:putative aldouronate transport system permease protein
MFLPFFVSWVVIVAIVDAILGYDYGIINSLLESLGFERFNIYVNAAPWPFLLVMFNVWKSTGYGSIVYLAAITGMDQEIVEASEIDGANIWKRIHYITLPCLKPTVIIMLLLAIGNIFRGDFGMFYQLIGNNSVLLEVGDILDLFVYRAMVSSSNLGMASAAGFYQSVLCFFTIIAANWLVKKYEPDYSLF